MGLTARHAGVATAKPMIVVMAALVASLSGVVPAGLAVPTAAPAYDGALSHPVADPDYPDFGTTSVDALHYGLDLTWNTARRELSGTATILLRATRDESRISLDFGRPLRATRVTLDGRPVTSTHSGHKLRIDTGPLHRDDRYTVTVRYHGHPHPTAAPTRRGDIPGLGWTVQPDGQTWTMQEPYGAFTWYPVNDQPSDKAYYDITAHVQKSWRAVSNGEVVAASTHGDERTMHWRLDSPVASYLVTLAIGPYRRYRDTGPHGLPITYWVRPKDTKDLKLLRRTPAMIRWLEARLGPFPFNRIGAVLVPSDSGMETQTMVTIGPSAITNSDPEYGISNLLHEYAHQWYGDEVTPSTWPDLWLNESFAMYFQIEWLIDHHYATAREWNTELRDDDQYLRTRYGPPGHYHPDDFAEDDVYYCGARMLIRLRGMLGAKLFGKVLRGWPASRRYGTGDRAEWTAYLDATTGLNLRGFVHKWLDSPTPPG